MTEMENLLLCGSE